MLCLLQNFKAFKLVSKYVFYPLSFSGLMISEIKFAQIFSQDSSSLLIFKRRDRNSSSYKIRSNLIALMCALFMDKLGFVAKSLRRENCLLNA